MEQRGGYRLIEAKIGTPPTQIEVLPIHDVNSEALASFFRDCYGCAYQGDESLHKKIQRSSHAVILEDFNRAENVAGAALIAGRRILAMATTPTAEYEGTRYENAVTLLRECVAKLQCQWVTIGQEYSRVQDAAYDAGLRRVHDLELVQGLLIEASETDNYEFRYDDAGGLMVARITSEFRPDYEQQFWVHLPEDIYDTTGLPSSARD